MRMTMTTRIAAVWFYHMALAALSLHAAARDTFNVRDFGAIADGKTSTTRQLQAAIDACDAAGGGTVLVPAGT